MLDSLPDGIHSGLAREGAQGVFFYFQADAPEGKLHFWKYYDLKDQRVLDNRYVIANLIACERDAPRVVEPEMFQMVFDLQEKVIEDILRSFEEQRALQSAPRSVDAIQQTLATVVQGYMNHPQIDRRQAIEAIRFLNRPMLTVQVRRLRKAYKDFQIKADAHSLLADIEDLRQQMGEVQSERNDSDSKAHTVLRREDLLLICFDFITGG